MKWAEAIENAVGELAAIPFFPAEDGARFAIMRAVEKFVSGPEELRWLVDTAVNHMRKWPGIAELRGLYCTRFSPLDGIEENCTTAGFTPADSEARYLLEENDRKHKEISAARSNHPLRIEGIVAASSELSERCGIVVEPKPQAPIRIPATRVRTPEERERLKRSMEAKLGIGGAA